MKMILNNETRERDIVVLVDVVPYGKLENALMNQWKELDERFHMKKSSVYLGCFGVRFRNDPIHSCNQYEFDFNDGQNMVDFLNYVNDFLYEKSIEDVEAFAENYEVLFVERKECS